MRLLTLFTIGGAALVGAFVSACRAPRVASEPRETRTTSAVAARVSSCERVELSRAGLDMLVLGSGGPRSAGRAASSYLFSVDGVPRFVVDVGPGSFARLGESGVRTEKLDVVLLTHLHIDHAGDLPALVKSRDLFGDRPVSFRVYGPEGRGPYPSTRVFVDRLFGREGAYAYLSSFRNELSFDVHDLSIDLDAPPRVVLEDSGVKIMSVAVDHADVPAVAYRIEHGGRSFVVSGDLASKRGRIVELARDADVLVYDTAVRDRPGSPENLYDLHTPPRRIGEIATEARAKSVLLSHVPPNVDKHRDEVLASVRASFAGDVRFASDCMHVAPEVAAPAHRVVFEVTTDDEKAWDGVLNNVENLQRALGPATIEVVAHGEGLGMLVAARDAAVRARIEEDARKGVVFLACENTMKKKRVAEEDLVPAAKTVDSGVAEVVRKQEAGWSYVRSTR